MISGSWDIDVMRVAARMHPETRIEHCTKCERFVLVDKSKAYFNLVCDECRDLRMVLGIGNRYKT